MQTLDLSLKYWSLGGVRIQIYLSSVFFFHAQKLSMVSQKVYKDITTQRKVFPSDSDVIADASYI